MGRNRMNGKREHKHSHIHNNTFEPDNGIYAEVVDEQWKRDYDLELLATRDLGNNLHIIISIPHVVYGVQRYDVVRVNEATQIIESVEHRGRNTSVRLVFNNEAIEDGIQAAMDHLIEIGCSLDPYNNNLIAVDLDKEGSRDIIKEEMDILLESNVILDWEYVIQEDSLKLDGKK